MKVWGNNGYPEVVPNTNWAAATVFSDNGPVFTSIYAFCDDPLFSFRDVKNSPWFNGDQCEIINLPHRKVFWQKEARTYALDDAAAIARDKAFVLECRESIFKHRWATPLIPFEIDAGGWLPNLASADSLSQVAKDVLYRQRLRAEKNYEEADLVRRSICSGAVEIADHNDGTMWFFA